MDGFVDCLSKSMAWTLIALRLFCTIRETGFNKEKNDSITFHDSFVYALQLCLLFIFIPSWLIDLNYMYFTTLILLNHGGQFTNQRFWVHQYIVLVLASVLRQ